MPGLVLCGSKVALLLQSSGLNTPTSITSRRVEPGQNKVEQPNQDKSEQSRALAMVMTVLAASRLQKRREGNGPPYQAMPAEVKSMSTLQYTRLGCGAGLERILACALLLPLPPHSMAMA